MRQEQKIQLFKLMRDFSHVQEDKAEEIVNIIADTTDAEKHYVSKEDFFKEIGVVKELINNRAWQIVGAMFVMLSLAVAVIKMS